MFLKSFFLIKYDKYDKYIFYMVLRKSSPRINVLFFVFIGHLKTKMLLKKLSTFFE